MGTEMKKIAKEIEKLQEKYERAAQNKPQGHPVDRKQFTLLLGGLSVCMRTPGIPAHMGYESLYHCESAKDAEQVKGFLQRMFYVTDKETLLKACEGAFHSSYEYGDFLTFWCGAPIFELDELDKPARKGFRAYKECAEYFYPIVKERGFYAWDIDGRIGLCRRAVACGILSEEEFWQVTDPWVRMAQVFYHSFEEYAISALCGLVYDMGKNGEDDIAQIFDNNKNMAEHLLEEGGAWQRNAWYEPKEREWAAPLMRGGHLGGMVTQKALTVGVGYICRQEPAPEYADVDSGWRFFAGDESDEYLDDPEHTKIMTLDSVCNLWPEVMGFLYAKVGRKFGKTIKGWTEE